MRGEILVLLVPRRQIFHVFEVQEVGCGPMPKIGEVTNILQCLIVLDLLHDLVLGIDKPILPPPNYSSWQQTNLTTKSNTSGELEHLMYQALEYLQ